MPETTLLYRPTGQPELDLVAASDYRAWPPRLPEQPIFYPVTNEEYAVQIARDWNTTDEGNGCVGYVTRFAIETDWLTQFPVQTVGGRQCTEYWIPAERVAEMNEHIVGRIEVIRKFTAEGEVPV